jgi:hypothetical protein
MNNKERVRRPVRILGRRGHATADWMSLWLISRRRPRTSCWTSWTSTTEWSGRRGATRCTPTGCGTGARSCRRETRRDGSSCTAAPRGSSSSHRCTTCVSAGWSVRASRTTTRRCVKPRRNWGCQDCPLLTAVQVPLRDGRAHLVVLGLGDPRRVAGCSTARGGRLARVPTEKELERRLTEWTWVPDGLAAYRRLLAWREQV